MRKKGKQCDRGKIAFGGAVLVLWNLGGRSDRSSQQSLQNGELMLCSRECLHD